MLYNTSPSWQFTTIMFTPLCVHMHIMPNYIQMKIRIIEDIGGAIVMYRGRGSQKRNRIHTSA